jgi:murein DD-endopeptidase MepM/ murein hydrolase activator NlpD
MSAATIPAVSVASPAPLIIPVSDGFDYPVGNSKRLTQANDGDGWYVARDFGENNHLGEDWNKESGGNTDCGLPVYAVSKGTIIFAGEAGPGWGKVVIIRHRLPGGALVETLYGHLSSIARAEGDVERRESVGQIGDADGAYPCHLHFELRLSDCPFWGLTGPGYSADNRGWTDPSNFIDARSNLPGR